jgi:hypothetical protein
MTTSHPFPMGLNVRTRSRWLYLLLPCIALATNASPGVELVEAFVRFHASMVDRIEKDRKADPEAAKQLEQGVMALYKVDAGSFKVITNIGREIRFQLSRLTEERDAYVMPFMRQRRLPDVNNLKRFEDRRVEILRRGLERLRQDLPSSSWDGLQKFMHDVLRRQMKTGLPAFK